MRNSREKRCRAYTSIGNEDGDNRWEQRRDNEDIGVEFAVQVVLELPGERKLQVEAPVVDWHQCVAVFIERLDDRDVSRLTTIIA